MSAVVWPADRFFWAVLEAPGVRAGVLPSGLEAELQDELPIPVEELHPVCVPAEKGRVLVCAARRDDLRDMGPDVLSVRPETVPESVESTSGVPELLTGDFEPVVFRRERSRRHLLIATCLLLCSGLLSLGLVRRAGGLLEQAQAALSAESELVRRVIPSGEASSLAARVEHARRSLGSDRAVTPDAAVALSGLLGALPKEVEFEASSISISPSSMSLLLTTKEDARQLLAAVRAAHGWRLDEPRLTTLPNATRVSVSMRPVGGGQP